MLRAWLVGAARVQCVMDTQDQVWGAKRESVLTAWRGKRLDRDGTVRPAMHSLQEELPTAQGARLAVLVATLCLLSPPLVPALPQGVALSVS